ncbi:MAG: 50S ribosomal protein L18 [Candidatus Alcyoniella australis]|nr:50S ribosomal protein L18 [Candidatus Alcyoniella australis]
MSVNKSRHAARKIRRARVRRKVRGSPERPRLCVFKSARHIYAQVIDDVNMVTLSAASTTGKSYSAGEEGGKVGNAKIIGEMIAQQLLNKGIKSVVFDRNGFLYHGRIKALAEAARGKGLEF